MMAPPRTMATTRTLPATMTTTQLRGIVKKSSKEVNSLQNLYRKYINFDYLKYFIFDPAALPIISLFIIAAELILNFVIITRVSYTEIDWIAYMQECEGFLNGTTNYALLKGDTGPLVYPSAFLYIYSALYFITSRGQNIRLAQYIFAIVYLIQMWLVLRLYTKSRKVPPYALALSAFTSYRIHSIYVLRLFNDPLAMLFLYAALNLFIERRWTFGSCLYSLAVGIKMNILLFAPALLLFYITSLGYRRTFQQLSICGAIQLILGAPFLLTYPWAYLRGSFDLGRVFEHKWTVNYRFLDRTIFEHIFFHLTLLVLHLVLLAACAKPAYIFFKNYVRLRELQIQLQPQIDRQNEELSKHSSPSKQKNVQKLEQVKKVDDEKLTHEQEAFLKSFEKCLQKSSGLVVPNRAALANNTLNENPSESNSLAIHFDQCSQLALLPLFFCNFIGVMCARSLHYQFYVWYFHSLPYLAWSTNYSLALRFLLLGLIEMCWNTYPSTNFSSLTLHCCHLMLLIGVIRNMLKTMKLSSTTLNSQLRESIGCTKDTKKSKTK